MKSEGPVIRIKGEVFRVREQMVVSAAAAAAFYGVSPAALMRAVKRAPRKFTQESMFRLSAREQSAIPALNSARKPALVFTELGVSMLSTVLKSPKAISVHIQIIRDVIKGMQTTEGGIGELFKIPGLKPD